MRFQGITDFLLNPQNKSHTPTYQLVFCLRLTDCLQVLLCSLWHWKEINLFKRSLEQEQTVLAAEPMQVYPATVPSLITC